MDEQAIRLEALRLAVGLVVNENLNISYLMKKADEFELFIARGEFK